MWRDPVSSVLVCPAATCLIEAVGDSRWAGICLFEWYCCKYWHLRVCGCPKLSALPRSPSGAGRPEPPVLSTLRVEICADNGRITRGYASCSGKFWASSLSTDMKTGTPPLGLWHVICLGWGMQRRGPRPDPGAGPERSGDVKAWAHATHPSRRKGSLTLEGRAQRVALGGSRSAGRARRVALSGSRSKGRGPRRIIGH
jgi:hypothetical protein